MPLLVLTFFFLRIPLERTFKTKGEETLHHNISLLISVQYCCNIEETATCSLEVSR